jgi:hypothetical protein
MVGYSYKAVEDKMPATKDGRNSEPTYVAPVMAYGEESGYAVRLERDMLEAECNKLRAIKYELLAALVDTVGVARRALTNNGTDIEVVDNRLKNALTAIARAEGKQ